LTASIWWTAPFSSEPETQAELNDPGNDETREPGKVGCTTVDERHVQDTMR
jgi:hypothetical protein